MTDEYASAARRASHDTPTLRMIEKEGRRRGASRKLIRAVKTIACIESSCGVNPIPAREKSRTWAKLARKVTSNKQRQDALMHSWGSTQLSGIYTYLDYGVEPEQLLDDEVSIPISFDKAEKLFRQCRESTYCTYAKWNGTGEKARQYARKAQVLEAFV